jgi:hypothetical protein
LKRKWHSGFAKLRERFILTADEQRIVAFVIAAFLLGVAVKYYRDANPRTLSIDKKQPWKKENTTLEPASSQPKIRKKATTSPTPASQTPTADHDQG